MEIQHRWETPRTVSVTVGDSPDAWRNVGFFVDDDGSCVIGGVDFRLVGDDAERGVQDVTFEADTLVAQDEPTINIRGLTYHVMAPGTAGDMLKTPDHSNLCTGIQKLEICPVETWFTLTQMVHRILPPPYQAFPYRNPDGNPQHVALWRMQNMEVFEMADGMGQTTNDEMAMFFLIVSDLDASREMIGANNCTEPFPMGENRRGMVLSNKALNLSVRTFMMEPLPETNEP